jgi:hypothetical protein
MERSTERPHASSWTRTRASSADAADATAGAGSTAGLALGLPRTLWSGSSSTREPVARLHALEEDVAAAAAAAAAELRAFVAREIAPEFERLSGARLREALRAQLEVETWSVEGDELHQLVDCVVLGPYAAAELAPRVRVNCIAPGSIEFPGGVWDLRKQAGEALYDRTLSSIPFGRMGTPEEIAEVALFLASTNARWVTGQVIAVDGGRSITL